jgi:hypothetical protein
MPIVGKHFLFKKHYTVYNIESGLKLVGPFATQQWVEDFISCPPAVRLSVPAAALFALVGSQGGGSAAPLNLSCFPFGSDKRQTSTWPVFTAQLDWGPGN